jgi:uncharacterized protein with GYD domain
LLKDGGSKRRAVTKKLFESVGGSLEAYYPAFGDTDRYVIAEFPNYAAVTARVLSVNAAERPT